MEVVVGSGPAGVACAKTLLVSAAKFAHLFSVPFEDWLVQLDAEVVHTITLDLRAGDPPVRWHLVKLR